MKFLAVLALLLSMVSCNSSPSKSEVVLGKLCMDMQSGLLKGLGKPFDEAKEKTKCDCTAKIMADKCGANCETQEGAAMFAMSSDEAMNKEITEKCK